MDVINGLTSPSSGSKGSAGGRSQCSCSPANTHSAPPQASVSGEPLEYKEMMPEYNHRMLTVLGKASRLPLPNSPKPGPYILTHLGPRQESPSHL